RNFSRSSWARISSCSYSVCVSSGIGLLLGASGGFPARSAICDRPIGNGHPLRVGGVQLVVNVRQYSWQVVTPAELRAHQLIQNEPKVHDAARHHVELLVDLDGVHARAFAGDEPELGGLFVNARQVRSGGG